MFARILCCLLLTAAIARAGVYQFAATGTDIKGKTMTTYLWVPPAAQHIRGVILAGRATSVEPEFCASKAIRDVCREQQLAIVYFEPHIAPLFDRDDQTPRALLDKALADIAKASGYDEIATAPWLPIGHSVSTVFAMRVVNWRPDRCFGVLLHKGAFGSGEGFDRVPALVMKGQFEEFGPGPHGALRENETREIGWTHTRNTLVARQKKGGRALTTMLVEPGATHFAWNTNMADYVAAWIRAVAQLRLPPADARADAATKLGDIAFADGFGTTMTIDKKDGPPPAPAAACLKQHGAANWHPTRELAAAAQAIHADLHKRPQFVTFADPETGKPVLPGHDLRLRYKLHWVAPGHFQAAAVFLDRVPRKYPPVAGEIGHVEDGPFIKTYGGQAERVGDNIFAVRLDPRKRMEANLLAYARGDDRFRYAEQGAILKLPRRLTKGKAQTITFPAIGKINQECTELKATSDSDLPVSYYVDHGPARIVGNSILVPTPFPARATRPMKIAVVAYQYGSAVEPYVQTAEPVRQEIELVK